MSAVKKEAVNGGAPSRVLLVEDHPLNSEIATDILECLGFEADVARTGTEALEMYRPEVHAVVFMDLQMPEMDGLEATRQLRARGATEVPIVAMTANVGAAERVACAEAGMNDFVGKPFGIARVREILDKWAPPASAASVQGRRSLVGALLSAFLVFAANGLSAQAPPEGLDLSAPSSAQDFRWRTAGGNYLDPTSFFSLHGYVDGVFAGKSADWLERDPATPGAPGQVLVPNTPHSSFQYDAALFVGSELSPDARLMMEWHLVSDPSGRGAAGPGGLTMVMTEATASWDLLPELLTLSGGLFWAPFASVNRDWLGAQNLFTLMPIASGIFPAHLNERGIRLDGVHAFSARSAVNYVVSVGNGTSSFDIGGQGSYDANENKTVTGRVGFFPGLGSDLEIGLSAASGELRDESDTALPAEDPRRYPADFDAWALDGKFTKGNFTLRGYGGGSLERLGVVSQSLNRSGAMAEASYQIDGVFPFGIKAAVPKFRVDYARQEALNGALEPEAFRSAFYSFGATLFSIEQVQISVEYHLRRELQRLALDNDRFVVRFSAEF